MMLVYLNSLLTHDVLIEIFVSNIVTLHSYRPISRHKLISSCLALLSVYAIVQPIFVTYDARWIRAKLENGVSEFSRHVGPHHVTNSEKSEEDTIFRTRHSPPSPRKQVKFRTTTRRKPSLPPHKRTRKAIETTFLKVFKFRSNFDFCIVTSRPKNQQQIKGKILINNLEKSNLYPRCELGLCLSWIRD